MPPREHEGDHDGPEDTRMTLKADKATGFVVMAFTTPVGKRLSFTAADARELARGLILRATELETP